MKFTKKFESKSTINKIKYAHVLWMKIDKIKKTKSKRNWTEKIQEKITEKRKILETMEITVRSRRR